MKVLMISMAAALLLWALSAGAAPDWSAARTVTAKPHAEAVIDPLNSREIQVTRIAATNDAGNLYIRLTTDADLSKSLNFNYNPEHEFKYVAPEVLYTNIWFDTAGGGETNPTFKELNGVDYTLRVDQEVLEKQLPNGMFEGYLNVTLSKYEKGNWEEIWRVDSTKRKNVEVSGHDLIIQVPLSRIGKPRQIEIKQCNTTMLFDPKHYTEMGYQVR